MRKLLIVILWGVILCPVTLSQKPYLITEYHHDLHFMDEAEEALDAKAYARANRCLHQFKGKRQYDWYLLKAKVHFQTGGPVLELLDSMFHCRKPYQKIDPRDSLYLSYKSEIDSLAKIEFRSPQTLATTALVLQMLENDQAIRQTQSVGNDVDYRNRQLLDSLIEAEGWPSSQRIWIKSASAAIILTHQGNLTADDYTQYTDLLIDLCLARKERWDAATQIIEQRYQWLGSDLRVTRPSPDTLRLKFDTDGQLSKERTHPYLVAFYRKLWANKTQNLVISVPSEERKQQIRAFMKYFGTFSYVNKKFIAYLRKVGHEVAPLDEARITIHVRPEMKPDELAYKFVW